MILKGKAGLLFLALTALPFGCSFSRSLPVGSKAPDFNLPSLSSPSQQIRLSEINRENPVLLVFWASWCPNCVAEIPKLNEIFETKSAKGLKMIAVNVEETRDDILEFMKKTPVKYPVLLDEHGKTANLYGLAGIPVALYLEKGGEILYYGYELPGHLDQLLERRRS